MYKMKEIDDGKKDVCIMIEGKTLVVMHEEGYLEAGLDYEQAKQLGAMLHMFLTISINEMNKNPDLFKNDV